MSRSLDPHQLKELASFVNALAELGGYTVSADWSRDSDYPAPNLSNLRNGQTDVSGYNLLKLIRAAARRIDERPVDVALAAARNVALDEAPGRPEIVRRLEEVEALALRAEALARLAAGSESEAERPPGEEPRAPESRQGKSRRR